ncbi:MAG: AMP-binding protein [Desulfobacteraceae bacterium]|nr:AMP-binding protein [Desulfobacteraceae bacterium]
MQNDPIRERVVHRVLERQAVKYGNRTFLYFKDQAYGYEDFNRAANRVSCGLQKLGISKGDKVAIVLGNCPEYLFLWFGISKLGAVEVPINTAHKGEILTYMLDQSDACMLVMGIEYLDRVEPILPDVPKIKNLVVIDTLGQGVPKSLSSVADWEQLVDNDGGYKPVDVLWSDPSGIMFTSGTTGPSKAALMPHNYPLYMGDIIIESAEYDEHDILYNALPLFHGNAQQLSFMPALMSGARTVLAEKFSAGRFWDDIKRYGCTEFNYLGAIVPILYKAEPKDDDEENPLRVMVGAAAPRDIFEDFEQRFGVTLIEIYGMNEIGLPLTSNLQERKPGSCGKARRDYALKLIDDDGLEVGPHTTGEILTRPLQPYRMMLEYYKMPDKTVETWRDLWFHTGDYAYFDEEGYFFFVDRKKDALRRRGENISSYEVEKVINSHPAVLESAAVAVKSDLSEDELMVCLTLRPQNTLTPLELVKYCEDRMAYFMIPRYVRIMDQLPKTATERVRKVSLREEGVTLDTWDRERAGYKLSR